MNTLRNMPTIAVVAGAAILVALGAAGGYWSHHLSDASAHDRKALYWYDPMVPNQRFDQPGKSPFMDMQLVPKYADEADNAGSLAIDPSIVQNLGIRLTRVQRGTLSQPLEADGSITFDQRHIAIVQSRTSGFVTRTYARAPGDLVRMSDPLLDLLVPEWAGAQAEFLTVINSGDHDLIAAARQRLILLGMPADLVARVAAAHEPRSTLTVRAPFTGAIESLDAREGMTVAAGSTLAKISAVASVWLEAAVPESRDVLASIGKRADVYLTAFPGERFNGQVIAVLPEADSETRTLRVRIELANPGGRLKPGMFAQARLESGNQTTTLYVASEAIIHTGTRAVVIAAGEHGRFIPTEVRTGEEAGGKTVILDGLKEGEQVVASGQFLIDSEASLRGVLARLAGDREPGGTP